MLDFLFYRNDSFWKFVQWQICIIISLQLIGCCTGRSYNKFDGLDYTVNDAGSNETFGEYSAHLFTRHAQKLISTYISELLVGQPMIYTYAFSTNNASSFPKSNMIQLVQCSPNHISCCIRVTNHKWLIFQPIISCFARLLSSQLGCCSAIPTNRLHQQFVYDTNC